MGDEDLVQDLLKGVVAAVFVHHKVMQWWDLASVFGSDRNVQPDQAFGVERTNDAHIELPDLDRRVAVEPLQDLRLRVRKPFVP